MFTRSSRRSVLARSLALSLVLGSVGAMAAPVFAQPGSGDELTPPVPAPPRNPPSHLMGIAAGIVLGCLVVGVNFIPSKRGHQD